ncbi:TRAP transporter large permease [Nocardioides sp. AE5]|uniref:TRAP transporter large permease n=1 Tax=Nocardioides sp. AE5 TaxID=2962573 RepID=UPI0028820C2B|nr:TRAP transporter large permease [Nocardioides sp. AE5]MDT0202619.1 TRAP transporter large permease [Nocardioides sp. AE5]
MTPELATLIVVGAFIALLMFECPIFISLTAAGALGVYLLRDDMIVTAVLGDTPYTATSSYTLSIIPMYILLGMFVLHGRLAERLFIVAAHVFRRIPGGLGVATVAACAGFAAVCGSSVATAATVGKVSILEMRKRGYPSPFAGGIVAAAGTLGVLIPPSILLVLYGVLASESIQGLLLAGIGPGILTTLAYITVTVVIARKVVATPDTPDSLADVLPDVTAASRPASVQTAQSTATETLVDVPQQTSRWPLIRAVSWIGLIFAVIILGIYSGIFTVVESAAVAAVVALVMMIVESWSGGMRRGLRKLLDAAEEAAAVTSMSFAIMVGAMVLTFFLVLGQVPTHLTTWVLGMDLPPTLVIIALLLLLVPMGMFLESLSLLVIFVPLTHPLVVTLGFDGIWYGLLVVKLIELSLITPPVGMNVFVVAGTSNIPPEKLFRGVLPFVAAEAVVISLLIAFPAITLWLPSTVGSA